ncbi:MAG: Esterase/lipase/thioesterase [Actinomycetia bacterium]|nr:Esterase/lipase/thioesterase [Actinomycetes bacterium]
MPVLPALQPLLDAVNAAPPPATGLSVAQLRENAHAMMARSFGATQAEGPPVKEQHDHRVAVDGGQITVRVYVPEGDGPFPAHVYFHGGGFWLGTLEASDDACRALAVDAGCIVVSVDYRLAPETQWPLPPEDCFAALRWTVDHADELGIDATCVSVGGGSAGGNLAAVVALMARDRKGPALVLQVLEIPVTDLTLGQPSIDENGEGYLLTRRSIEQYTSYYLADPAVALHPYASPLFAEDLSGLPPAIVMTAEMDPLRDEGEAYAQRLAEAGVAVEAIRWDGQIHGSQAMAKVIPEEAAAYHAAIVAALSRAYGR